jgi:hypothetical protein
MGVSVQLQNLVPLPPEKELPGTHRIKSSLDPTVGLNALEKGKMYYACRERNQVSLVF